MRPSLLLGTIAAIVAALLGAAVWAAVTATTHFQIGYMAVGVGILTGYAMRLCGGGRARADGVIAAVVALLGCVLGNLAAISAMVAEHEHYPLLTVLAATLLHPALGGELLRDDFNVMDLLFYGLAVYAGYRTAMKPAAQMAAETGAEETPQRP